MTIDEGNIILAEFEELKQEEMSYGRTWRRYDEKENMDMVYRDCELQYHLDWEWLMRVCVLFTSIRYFDTVKDGKHNRDPRFAQRLGELSDAVGTFNKPKAWMKLVEVVQWYNKVKTEPVWQ
jgi:hypothetical protein